MSVYLSSYWSCEESCAKVGMHIREFNISIKAMLEAMPRRDELVSLRENVCKEPEISERFTKDEVLLSPRNVSPK